MCPLSPLFKRGSLRPVTNNHLLDQSIGNHRPIEQFSLEGTFRSHLVHSPCNEQEHQWLHPCAAARVLASNLLLRKEPSKGSKPSSTQAMQKYSFFKEDLCSPGATRTKKAIMDIQALRLVCGPAPSNLAGMVLLWTDADTVSGCNTNREKNEDVKSMENSPNLHHFVLLTLKAREQSNEPRV